MTGMNDSVRAANRNNARYYYYQLSAGAKQIYDAMYQMYEQGIFKTGTQSYDLVENGHITEESLAACEGNFEGLLEDYGAARDAFYADYPDIFYVDFSNLAISVEGGSQGGYKAYLGKRDDKESYYVEGFTDSGQVEEAIGAHEARVNRITEGAGNAPTIREQVIYINNAVIEGTEYRLEEECGPGNRGHIRTSYGALVKGESLCEGYARAMKAVLDSMGITSVLVQGYYQEEDGSRKLHMWNYVQIDGKWYGLDATANDGMSGSSSQDTYLLADGSVMEAHHIPDGVMSPGGVCFTYPQLERSQTDNPDSGNTGTEEGGETSPDMGTVDNEGFKVVFSQNGLVVGYRDGTKEEGEVGVFKISYKGMGYQEAVEKEGVYILSRFYQYMPGSGENVPGNWGYSDPKPFMMPNRKDALIIANGNSKMLEFAVTTMPPKGPLYGEDLSMEDLKNNWNFQGTESDFLVSTGQLQNPKGNYVPSPYAVTLTPNATGYLRDDMTYSIKAVFNEQLEEYDGKTAGYKLTVQDGWSAVENSKIEEFEWDGDRTVTFKFTPSRMISDNYARYAFEITGLRGKGSLKVPDVFTYDVKKKISVCAYRPQGYYWNVFAKPELLEPGDLSCNGWKLSTGEKLEDVVTNITLVASKPELVVTTPDAEQNKDMLDKIENNMGDTVVKSATYNIELKMCNTSIVNTGSSVRMSVGFPEGYGPDSEGVVYKAYHFIKKDGKIVGVEPIDCVVTQYGLVIATKSFSPFAVAAVKEDNTEPIVKKVLLLNSAGGEVEGEPIRTLERAQSSQTVTVRAKDGYRLNSINLSGKELQITDDKVMNIELSFDTLVYDENIMDVNFVQEKPKEEKPKEERPKEDKHEESGSSGKKESGSGSSSEDSGSGQAAPAKAPAAQPQTQQPVQQTPAQPQTPAQTQTQASAQTKGQQSASGTSASGTKGGADISEPEDENEAADAGTEEDWLTASAKEQTDKETGTEKETKSDRDEKSQDTEEAFEAPSLNENKTFGIILASIAGVGAVSIGCIIFLRWRG